MASILAKQFGNVCRICPTKNCTRGIPHSSFHSSNRITQQIKIPRMLEKMMKKGGKRKWHESTPKVFTNTGSHRKFVITDGSRRRAEQLSKVLCDHIIGLINSGELHPDLVDYSVDIAMVKMAPDFSGINVYWHATGDPCDEHTQHLLDQTASKLREMLISLQVIGNVPKVQFVKDETNSRIVQVEKLLAIADMGPKEDDLEGISHTEPQPNAAAKIYTEAMINNDFRKVSFLSDNTLSKGSGRDLQGTVSVRNITCENVAGEFLIPNGSQKEKNSDQPEYVAHEDVETYGTKPSIFSNNGNSFQNDSLSSKITFRNDLYKVNREELARKVFSVKSKLRDRNMDSQMSEKMPQAQSVGKLPTKPKMKSLNVKPPKYSVRDHIAENLKESESLEEDNYDFWIDDRDNDESNFKH